MSRINKYRAWNKEKKIMCYKHEDEEQHWFDGACCSDVEMINGRFNSGLSAYEYMQYIGIDDKNGKEICERDIVKIHQFLFDGCEYEKEIVVSIEYMDEMACFGANLLQAKEIRAYMGYDNKTNKQEKIVVPLCNFYGLHDESFEVIGNVYENADFLKEANGK